MWLSSGKQVRIDVRNWDRPGFVFWNLLCPRCRVPWVAFGTQRRGSENHGEEEISRSKSFPPFCLAIGLKFFKLSVPLSQFPHHCLTGLVKVKKHEMDFQQSLTNILAISSCVLWGTILPLFCQWLFFSAGDSTSIQANSTFNFFVLESSIFTWRYSFSNFCVSQTLLKDRLKYGFLDPMPRVSFFLFFPSKWILLLVIFFFLNTR